jgi:hypothetical protein
MIPMLQVNDLKAQVLLNDLREALIGQGQMGDAATILEDQYRLLLKEIIRLTPPLGFGSDARIHGEEAIKRDMTKIFTPVDEEMLNVIGSQFGVSGIDQWITDADGKKNHLIWDRLDATGEGIERFHHANQNRFGRTVNLKQAKRGPFWYAAYVVSKADFEPYLDRLISHVGRRKAAWAAGYQAVGGKVQRWIARHLPSPCGRVENNLSNRTKPSIATYNSSPNIREDKRIRDSAMRIRRESLKRRLKLVLSGYSKDVAQRMRITRKAHKTPDSFEA